MNKLCFALLLGGVLMFLAYGCNNDHSPATPPDPADDTGSISCWLTSETEAYLFAKQKSIDFSTDIGDYAIQLDTTVTYQTMDGFGAALTGSSAFLINNLSAENRTKLLTDLFDPENGIGITYLRITIGSSDFSIGTYSYCDTGDMNDFDIPSQDRKDLLPVLKAILQINPNIKILGSPWSAPAWMKQNGNMFGGSLKKDPVIYNDFADYFVKYVKAFENEGIHIDAITIQNEPMNENFSYPTMKMEWNEENMIIRDYLGPKFAANGIQTKILIWDHNFDMESYPENILNDPQTRKYVAGTAWHGYAGDASAIDVLQRAHPDKDVYFTEISGGGWNAGTRMSTMFWYMQNFLMASVNRGSKNFLMWNLALNTKNGPTTTATGGCQDCRGVVTIRDDGTYYKELEYYLIGHFSKAVRSNAKRIKYTANNMPSGVLVSSFLNPDGSKAVVVLNLTGSLQKYNIRCGTRRFVYAQTAQSVATFKFN